MKHIFLLALTFISFSIYSQEKRAITIDSDEYRELKSQGKLSNSAFTLIQDGSQRKEKQTTQPSKIIARGGGSSTSANCGCWIQPDETYILSDFGANNVDDGSTENIPFPFEYNHFDSIYTSMWINSNGTVTFDGGDGQFTPGEFPNNDEMLAPFWADVDFGCADCGDLYYKVTEDAVYVNWVEVGYYNNSNDKVNSFQLIFTSDNSTVLPNQNNVQFCYQDMQWTTGNASGGIDGFDGSPAIVGANAGNDEDFVSFGAFDEEGDTYDGPFNNNDGVSWLDYQNISFKTNISTFENLPPLAIGTNTCDTLVLCSNDTEILEFTFIEFENDQSMTVIVDDGGFSGAEAIISSGSPADLTLTLTSETDETGIYDILVTVTDDGEPAASTTIPITLEVLGIEVPDFDIFYEGGLAPGALPYCQGTDGAVLSGSDGFDSYLWSTGSSSQSDTFTSGSYTLTAFFMGCDTQAGPVDIFEIPSFNPEVTGDFFGCEGDILEISVDDPESYDSINWSVFNNDGEIFSEDTEQATIEISTGFYQVVVSNGTACPGITTVPVSEEVINIPDTSFQTLCDGDDEISWSGAWANPNACYYGIWMFDNEGDSWEGANIQVFVDGIGPFNYNITNTSGFVTDIVQVYHGQVIEYFWTPGLDDDDIQVILLDENNQSVFDTDDGDGLTTGNEPFFTQIANCGFNALPGTWSVVIPEGGEGFEMDCLGEGIFNPVNGSCTFTAPEGFDGVYELSFDSDICQENDPISFSLNFSSASGGSVNTDLGLTESFVVVSDGMPDVIEFQTSSTNPSIYNYIITDENNNFLYSVESSYDFENEQPGTYYVYGISYSGEINGSTGVNINDLTSDGCFEISENFITITCSFDSSILESNKNKYVLIQEDKNALRIEGLETPSVLRIFNAMGQVVKTISNYQNGQILVSDLSQGAYFLSISEREEKPEVLRFIK